MKLSQGLEKLLGYINIKKGCYCLCYSEFHMYTDNIIDYKTHCILEDYITNNRPFTWYSFINITPFWWKPGLVKPRRKWLEKHIKKLQKKGL